MRRLRLGIADKPLFFVELTNLQAMPGSPPTRVGLPWIVAGCQWQRRRSEGRGVRKEESHNGNWTNYYMANVAPDFIIL